MPGLIVSLGGGGRFSMRGLLSLIAVLLVLPACGCGLGIPNVVKPKSVEYQQARADL